MRARLPCQPLKMKLGNLHHNLHSKQNYLNSSFRRDRILVTLFFFSSYDSQVLSQSGGNMVTMVKKNSTIYFYLFITSYVGLYMIHDIYHLRTFSKLFANVCALLQAPLKPVYWCARGRSKIPAILLR